MVYGGRIKKYRNLLWTKWDKWERYQTIVYNVKRKHRVAYLMHGAKNVGGGEYSIYFLIKNLRNDIFEPFVFYSNENEIIKRLGEDGIKLIHIPLPNRITSIYRDSIKTNPASVALYIFSLIVSTYHIIRLLKKNRIELLHPHDNLSKIIGGAAARLCGVKAVTHCRDDLKNDLIGRTLRLIYRFFTNRIIAVSEKTKKSLTVGSNFLTEKTTVIYNGVDLKLFTPKEDGNPLRANLKIRKGKTIITIVAVLERYKGHIYLFQAVKKLLINGVNNFVCLAIGDGREKENLLKYVNNEKLRDDILFLGYRKDVPELLNITDILVIPSIAQEAFPRVALESMAMRVPVICTDFGGLPEAVLDGETGIIVPPGDVDSLSKAIKYLIDNPEIRKKMGEAGRRRVEEMFSIVETNVRKTEGLYLDVLENS